MIADLTREELLVLVHSQAQVIKELREENTRLPKKQDAKQDKVLSNSVSNQTLLM